MNTRKGRPRRYDVQPAAGYAVPEIAAAAAWLAEIRERVIDQIAGLPPEALNYVAGPTKLSVTRLARHLAWADAWYVSRMVGSTARPAADLQAFLEPDALAGFTDDPQPVESAEQLINAIRRVATEVLEPTLRAATDFDAVVLEDGSTLRGLVMHLAWHWVYHGGQIGLLQFECGYDYEWTTLKPIVPRWGDR